MSILGLQDAIPMRVVHHSGIQPESAIVAALHIELMAQVGGPSQT